MTIFEATSSLGGSVMLEVPGYKLAVEKAVEGIQYILDLGCVVKAEVDEDTCIKCGRCVVACDEVGLQASEWGGWASGVLEDRCTECFLCMRVCPALNRITMKRVRVEVAEVPAHL